MYYAMALWIHRVCTQYVPMYTVKTHRSEVKPNYTSKPFSPQNVKRQMTWFEIE